MINIRQIQILPQNLDQFVSEIGANLRDMYGPPAEAAYAAIARESYMRLLGHAGVRIWGGDGAASAGLLIGIVRRGVAHITLLHVLASERGKGIEDALLDAATWDLRALGVRAIIGEFVRHQPLAVDGPMASLGFMRFDRRMMIADLADPIWSSNATRVTVRCGSDDMPAARVLVDAYADHPSRPIHPETHDTEDAVAFLKSFRGGAFGQSSPNYYRIYQRNGICEGLILGAEAAPDVGFVLHVATARASRGRGIGTELIRECATEFLHAGCVRMMLGVTCGNPAERLYERLGFQPFLPVESYVWWESAGDEP